MYQGLYGGGQALSARRRQFLINQASQWLGRNQTAWDLGASFLRRPISCCKVGAEQVHFFPHRRESGFNSRQTGQTPANAMVTGKERLEKPGPSYVSDLQDENSGGSHTSDKDELFRTTRTTESPWFGLCPHDKFGHHPFGWLLLAIASIRLVRGREFRTRTACWRFAAGGFRRAGIFFKL